MYPENPEGTRVFVGSVGYVSNTARTRTHNLRVLSQVLADSIRPRGWLQPRAVFDHTVASSGICHINIVQLHDRIEGLVFSMLIIIII